MTSKPNIISETDFNPASGFSITGRVDVQEKIKRLHAIHAKTAKKLHNPILYGGFGSLDGLSLSYGSFKQGVDVLDAYKPLHSKDALHAILKTDAGIAAACIESAFLMSFSILGNYFDDDDNHLIKRYIAVTWPYLRDALKGLKNAYKGTRGVFKIIELLGGTKSLNFMALHVGLGLGVLSALGRIWLRHMINERKKMMKSSANLLIEIQELESLSKEQYADFISKKRNQAQSDLTRGLAFLFAAYGGVIDGSYLYMGVFGITTFNVPALIITAIFCAFYAIACVITRIYEEYDYQRQLIVLHTQIQLALDRKRLEVLFMTLHTLSQSLAENVQVGDQEEQAKNTQSHAIDEFNILLKSFEKNRDVLRRLTTQSFGISILAGLKNGLAAYSSVSAVLFSISTILALATIPFPFVFVTALVAVGILAISIFVAYSVTHAILHRVQQEQQVQPVNAQLVDLLRRYKSSVEKNKNQEESDLIPDFFKTNLPDTIKTTLYSNMNVNPTPPLIAKFAEWFEALRCLLSGIMKGFKSIDYVFARCQEENAQGEYHDTYILIGIGIVSAILHAGILFLRAYARGFGRDPMGQVAFPAPAVGGEPESVQSANSVLSPQPASPLPAPADSSPPSSTSLAIQSKLTVLVGFFSSKERNPRKTNLVGNSLLLSYDTDTEIKTEMECLDELAIPDARSLIINV